MTGEMSFTVTEVEQLLADDQESIVELRQELAARIASETRATEALAAFQASLVTAKESIAEHLKTRAEECARLSEELAAERAARVKAEQRLSDVERAIEEASKELDFRHAEDIRKCQDVETELRTEIFQLKEDLQKRAAISADTRQMNNALAERNETIAKLREELESKQAERGKKHFELRAELEEAQRALDAMIARCAGVESTLEAERAIHAAKLKEAEARASASKIDQEMLARLVRTERELEEARATLEAERAARSPALTPEAAREQALMLLGGMKPLLELLGSLEAKLATPTLPPPTPVAEEPKVVAVSASSPREEIRSLTALAEAYLTRASERFDQASEMRPALDQIEIQLDENKLLMDASPDAAKSALRQTRAKLEAEQREPQRKYERLIQEATALQEVGDRVRARVEALRSLSNPLPPNLLDGPDALLAQVAKADAAKFQAQESLPETKQVSNTPLAETIANLQTEAEKHRISYQEILAASLLELMVGRKPAGFLRLFRAARVVGLYTGEDSKADTEITGKNLEGSTLAQWVEFAGKPAGAIRAVYRRTLQPLNWTLPFTEEQKAAFLKAFAGAAVELKLSNKLGEKSAS